ncbi:putative magnesium transporter NIPA1 [Ceratocystis lukuohia]|uniref:Magnesium transporter NIPA1 n=2 Tax=Ceratocystis TaxID=5157 RepID=A0ABR4M8H1_9PEZI|nr:putative magnesium transporter NIPA1 [Ceratocystis fimbriata CBS 114723]
MASDIPIQYAAHVATLAVRNGISTGDTSSRPASFKVIGITLAVTSGVFIGISFVMKKYGLLKANEKYNEIAGEGYGYLKNWWWWGGMILMILGEICNFVAYAFTDAMLVTPLGALAVVITTVLSAIFLKERLSLVGKVACFLCIVGSVVIVLNAPESSSVSNIQEMRHYVIAPGFLVYAGIVLVGSTIAAIYAGPRWGNKNMLVYISICSWVGGLSVVAIQGLGAAIVAQAQGTPQFNQWFLYVLMVFVFTTLITEIVYLNKALNIFNAALVTPTYYVYFTSTTIVSSAVLFKGMRGSTTSIITMANGFLTICAGVILLQLSKSSKDVPDTAVFNGDLDQIQTIGEQDQPETEPKADAIRGAAAIVRQISVTRQRREVEEFERLRQDKLAERLSPHNPGDPEYEWDGLRRRRTPLSRASISSRGTSIGPSAHGLAPGSSISATPAGTFLTPVKPSSLHPPLGMSRMPTEVEMQEQEELDQRRATSPSILSSIAGTIRSKRRMVPPTLSEVPGVVHPVPLTDIAESSTKHGDYSSQPHNFDLESQPTEYHGASAYGAGGYAEISSSPNSHSARRQFSFQNIFRKSHSHAISPPPTTEKEASTGWPSENPAKRNTNYNGRMTLGLRMLDSSEETDEERLGLVKQPTTSSSFHYGHQDDEEIYEEKVAPVTAKTSPYTRGEEARSPTQSLASPSSSEGENSPPSRPRIGGPYDVERLYSSPPDEGAPPPVPKHKSQRSLGRYRRESATEPGAGSGLSFTPRPPTTTHQRLSMRSDSPRGYEHPRSYGYGHKRGDSSGRP